MLWKNCINNKKKAIRTVNCHFRWHCQENYFLYRGLSAVLYCHAVVTIIGLHERQCLCFSCLIPRNILTWTFCSKTSSVEIEIYNSRLSDLRLMFSRRGPIVKPVRHNYIDCIESVFQTAEKINHATTIPKSLLSGDAGFTQKQPKSGFSYAWADNKVETALIFVPDPNLNLMQNFTSLIPSLCYNPNPTHGQKIANCATNFGSRVCRCLSSCTLCRLHSKNVPWRRQ